VILLLLILVLVAPAAAGESPWPTFRHDLRHTGRTPYTGPADPTVHWTFTAGDVIASSPTIGADGTVYFGAGTSAGAADSNLYAIKPDGSLKWTFLTEGGVFSAATIGPDGTLYFGSSGGSLYAVEDSVTYGKEKWHTPAGKVYTTPALGPSGTIYAGSLDFNLYAFSPAGAVNWEFGTGWCVFSSPAIGPDGEIYVGSKDHRIYCLEDRGTSPYLRWSRPVGTFYDGHNVDSSPALASDGTVYIGADPYGIPNLDPASIDTGFYALGANGLPKWSFEMENGTESSPAIGPDGTVYVGSFDNNLYAIRDEGDAGVVEWTFPTRGAVDGSPAVDGAGTIYVGSRDSTLYAVNPDGSLRWSFPADGEIESSPAIDGNGILYFGTFNGTLYALGTPGPDVGVLAVDFPEEVQAHARYEPAAAVGNLRASAQTFEVACTIDSSGQAVYADTVVVSDLPGAGTEEVYFTSWSVGLRVGVIYNLTFTTLLPGDTYGANDTSVVHVRAVTGEIGSSAGNVAAAEGDWVLEPCSPNPFTGQTTIRFALRERVRVRLTVYDVTGREVSRLAEDFFEPGRHELIWRGTDDLGRHVPPGVYFVSLRSEDYSAARKVLLVR
jgi:outer membrane protein assembly factor BamB